MSRKNKEPKTPQDKGASPSRRPAKPALTGNLAKDVYNELVAELGKERADRIMYDIAMHKARTTVISTKQH